MTLIDVLVSGIFFEYHAWYSKGLEVSTALHTINNITVFTVAGISTITLSTQSFYINGIGGVIVRLLSVALTFLI